MIDLADCQLISGYPFLKYGLLLFKSDKVSSLEIFLSLYPLPGVSGLALLLTCLDILYYIVSTKLAWLSVNMYMNSCI